MFNPYAIDKVLKMLAVQQPLTYKAVYPKRIIPPNGYMNPRYFSMTLYSELDVGYDTELRMLPHITGLMNCLMQLEYRVPTYFVRSEFAQAVAQTEPPDDFKLSEIRWPLPAMLFVLPTQFVNAYFGYLCPFLSITRSETAIYPDALKNLPKCEMSPSAVNRLTSNVPRMNTVYPVYSENDAPVDYTSSWPLSMNVNEMDDAPFEDATYLEESRSPEAFARKKPDANVPSGEAETLFNAKMQAFAVKLMLALTARPQVIKVGGLQRPLTALPKGKGVLDELWHPNLIGWEYRAQRVAVDGGGTHASPRMHWRRGTWRNQPYGPRELIGPRLRRLIWIEPCLISAEPETAKV